MSSVPPIYGHVLPALDAGEPQLRKATDRAWKKGYPRGTKKADVMLPDGTIPPPPPMPKSSRPPPPRGKPRTFERTSGRCIGCNKEVAAASLEMVGELVRIARDRLVDGGDGRTDLLYLAARLDGCCSVGCWREHVATEGDVRALFPDRR
jgi:hypothetical protein